MTWPEVTRGDPPPAAGERILLEAFLEYHRATLLNRCAGLTGEQLVERAAPPSDLSLLGLIRHMALVEQSWFRAGWQPDVGVPSLWAGPDPDADFHDTDPARADDDLAVYRREVDRARVEAAEHELTETARAPWRTQHVSLRWIYLHMIEEYARHNGHADLLRERIDGVTGE